MMACGFRLETMVFTRAFLSEAARLLVLCGHKHHQHFPRVTINAETDNEFELCVLNTGSPTKGKHAGTFGYNFSLVEIHRRSGAKITQYRSDGGTFHSRPAFWAETMEGCGKALLAENARENKFQCDAFAFRVEIGPDGDTVRTNFVTRFRYLGDDRTTVVPVEVRASVGTGQIEWLEVHSLASEDGTRLESAKAARTVCALAKT